MSRYVSGSPCIIGLLQCEFVVHCAPVGGVKSCGEFGCSSARLRPRRRHVAVVSGTSQAGHRARMACRFLPIAPGLLTVLFDVCSLWVGTLVSRAARNGIAAFSK